MYPFRCKKILLLMATLFALSLVSACGQKGDLYIPDQRQSSLPVIPPSA